MIHVSPMILCTQTIWCLMEQLCNTPHTNYDMVRYLLNNGAEVNKAEATFGTALQAAIRHAWRDSDIVELLLENGADVKQQLDPKSIETPFRPSGFKHILLQRKAMHYKKLYPSKTPK